MEKVGEKGEKPHGRDDEAAAATGPGKTTTDHQQTDSRSLATPASGPRVNQEIELDLVKPPPSPPSVESTTPPVQTSPHANESSRNGQEVVERDDDVRRVHEHVDNETSQVDTSKDETTTTTAGAPQSMSLEGEYIPQASDDSTELIVRKPDEVKATQDQDQESTTSASARSAPRDHPDDASTRNPTRPSEDPGDVTGDDEHRPDAPTEPPNKPLDKEVEGARVEGLEVETAVAEESRGVEEDPREDGSDERRPGMADEPPDEAQVESRGPDSVQVEPGGETIAG